MWQFRTRKLWNCPILWLWSGSWRQYRSRGIARWNETGEPSATGLKRKKKQTQQNILSRNTSARGRILPGTEKTHCSPTSFENLLGSLGKVEMHIYEVKVLLQFSSFSIVPVRTKWGGRGGKRRGHPFGSMQQGNGSGGKGVGPLKWSGEATVLLQIWGLSRILHAFIKQDNLPASLWHCASFSFWVVLETALNLWKYIVLLNIPDKPHNTCMWFPRCY